MNWPQITLLILCFMGICMAWYGHGKTETKKGNARTTMIALAINLFLLYMGGFFY